MSIYLELLISCSITIVAILSLGLAVIGLPGAWVLVGLSALMTFFADETRMFAMTLPAFIGLLVIALLGELIEFLAGAAGVKKTGGSRRAAALAIVGSIAGAIVGLFVGTPIPVVGSIVVSLLLGGVGAYGGAVVGERWKGREWDGAMQVGKAAFWGRLLGTAGKIVCTATIMSVVIGAAWLSS